MSDGIGTCKEIARQKTLGKIADTARAVVDIFNPAKWIEALGNKAKKDEMTVNVTNMNLSMEDMTKIHDECKNDMSSDQINKIVQSSDCIKEYAALCGILSDDKSKQECIKSMPKIENINQSNVLKSQMSCVINKVVDKLSQQSPTVENVAKMIAIQEQSGLMNNNESITSNCNEINQNVSSKNFLESVANCINKVSAKQKNVLKACGASNITQSNTADMIGDCLVKSGITTKNIADPSNKTKIESETIQKSKNTILFIILFIVIGIVAVIGGIFAFKRFMKSKELPTGSPTGSPTGLAKGLPTGLAKGLPSPTKLPLPTKLPTPTGLLGGLRGPSWDF